MRTVYYWRDIPAVVKLFIIGLAVGFSLMVFSIIGVSIASVNDVNARATARATCEAAGGVLVVSRDLSTACVASPIK